MISRPESLTSLLALTALTSAGLVTVSSAAEACTVENGRGWARGGGNGTLVMAKGGKNCGGSLWVIPEARLPVTSLQVTSPPASGRVTTRGNSYQYTPKAGFVGHDSFSLSGTGKDQNGDTVTLTGNIAVTVQ
jgi:hypothetical protein